MSIHRLMAAVILLTVFAGSVEADSIFDAEGIGRDVIPAVGQTRALAGAVVASKDPLSCSILNPFGAAFGDKITLSTGLAHTGTNTNNLGEEKQTVTTLFPSIALTVPLGKVSVMTGLFLEKEGRLSLAMRDSAYGRRYDIDYRRECSIHSVPIMVSAALGPKLIVSAGALVSFFDIREKTFTDFDSDVRADAEDIYDMYATGESFAAGLLLDLERVRLGALFRSKADLDGTLDSENRYAGLWASEDVAIASDESFNVGLLLRPARSVSIEADYHQSPWDQLTIDGRPVTAKRVERWALAAKYEGKRFWRASRYPLMVGYYRQPLDWESAQTGEITEEFFSVGTSIPIGDERALISVSVEMGRRRAKEEDDLSETIYGFSLSLSAMEAWRREIRR